MNRAGQGEKKLFILCAHRGNTHPFPHTHTHTGAVMYMNVLHVCHFKEPHRNERHNALLFHHLLSLSDYCVYFFYYLTTVCFHCQHLDNLQSSPSLLHSISPCVSLHHLCGLFSLPVCLFPSSSLHHSRPVSFPEVIEGKRGAAD